MSEVKGLSESVEIIFDPGSFRDRNGRVFHQDGKVFRLLNQDALQNWKLLSATQFFVKEMENQQIIPTEQIENPPSFGVSLADSWKALLKHQKIPFISYPYEWSFGMLKDAALLQLRLLQESLKEGMILKDSSPYNIQWIGTIPVFIDILSFEKWNAGEAWIGYRQFCQMFLYPLFLQSYKEISFQQWLRGSVDGIGVDQCNQIFSVWDWFRPGIFAHCYLQSKLQASYASKQVSVTSQLKSAGFSEQMILHNVKGLERVVEKLNWKRKSSEWSEYADHTSYSREDQDRKINFVRTAVQTKKWSLVWDLGCNTGVYSRIASENASYVLAMDADQLSVEQFYQELKSQKNQNILPLVMNLTDASSNLGWRGIERRGLKERGKADLALCLALIHHIVITGNVPMRDFIEWLSEQCNALIIEYVSKDDPMVKRLLLNKRDNYEDYEQEFFEKTLAEHFEIESREMLRSGTRTLYFARSRNRK
jgi:hypothetical protein